MPGRSRSLAGVAAVAAGVLCSTGIGAAATPPPYTTVARIQTLILASDYATNNQITGVTCVGLHEPKPKVNAGGLPTFHRFRCEITGTYLDRSIVVVFTGDGRFEALTG